MGEFAFSEHPYIGLKARDFAPTYLRDIGAHTAELALFRRVRPLQERISLSGRVQKLLRLREGRMEPLGVPFWDGVLLLSSVESQGTPSELWAGAVFHQEAIWTKNFELGLGSEKWLDVSSEEPPDHILTLSSRVTLMNSAPAHLALLDFSVHASPAALTSVLGALKSLGQSGYIVRSGMSYHFYGDRALEAHEWIAFLAQAMLLGPIVDRRWAAHQLLQGFSALRITAGGRAGTDPTVECVLPR